MKLFAGRAAARRGRDFLSSALKRLRAAPSSAAASVTALLKRPLSPFADRGRRAARKNRRGVSLFETSVAILLGVTVAAAVLSAARLHAQREAARGDVRALSDAAELAAGWAARDFTGLRARIGGGGAVLVSEAELRTGAALAVGRPLRGVRGGEIRFAAWRPTAAAVDGRIVILAWDASGNGPDGRIELSPGTDLVGRRGGTGRPCPESWLCGPNMRWNAADLFAALGGAGPAEGAMTAARLVTSAADSEPYLHRLEVAGAPHLNLVQGNFHAGGAVVGDSDRANLRDPPALAAGELETVADIAVCPAAGTPVADCGDTETGGADFAADLEIQEGADIAGDVTGGADFTAEGLFSAAALTVTATMEAGSWAGGNGSFEAVSAAGAAEIAGDASLTAGPFAAAGGAFAADLLRTGTLTTGRMQAESSVTHIAAGRGSRLGLAGDTVSWGGVLTVRGCTGCGFTGFGELR